MEHNATDDCLLKTMTGWKLLIHDHTIVIELLNTSVVYLLSANEQQLEPQPCDEQCDDHIGKSKYNPGGKANIIVLSIQPEKIERQSNL